MRKVEENSGVKSMILHGREGKERQKKKRENVPKLEKESKKEGGEIRCLKREE